MTIANAVYREGVAYSPDGALYVTPTGTASITGGQISDTTLTRPLGVEYKLAHSGIPVGLAPTGTMANNGAVTLGTALNTTYAASYLQYPAGAIAAGVPASAEFYWTVMSSTTVGVVFNNIMSANVDSNGIPQAPSSPTAFATTGPGAFTGTTVAVTMFTLTIAAAAIGTNGIYRMESHHALNNTAGTRTVTFAFGGTTMNIPTMNNALSFRNEVRANNRNSASIQSFNTVFLSGAGIAQGTTYGAINSGNAVSVTISCNRATATDTYVIENLTEWITNQ